MRRQKQTQTYGLYIYSPTHKPPPVWCGFFIAQDSWGQTSRRTGFDIVLRFGAKGSVVWYNM